MIEQIWQVWLVSPYWIRGLAFMAFAQLLLSAWCNWDNLCNSEGIDRLTWLCAITFLPIIGILAYFAVGIPAREKESVDDAEGWKKLLK